MASNDLPGEMDPALADEGQLRAEILDRVRAIHRLRKAREQFVPGKTRVNYAGRVFDEREMVAVIDSALDFWLTLGKKGAEFERAFARAVGAKHAVVTNSGSSANLLALTALTSPTLARPLVEGDEVITCALGFPTTVNPIIQNRLVPVFVDADEGTYNIDWRQLEAALSPRVRAIMFAHTLGNPAEMEPITQFAREHDLYLIEDCCDALGATYDGRAVGRFGQVATSSFYAAHHITMGEGGAVWCDDPRIETVLLSLRDWGRACYCPTGETHPLGKCRKRFSWAFDGLPEGYDHKYTYTHIGYNLKPLDPQCAMGLVQLDKLPSFVEMRRANFDALHQALQPFDRWLLLPRWPEKARPSWFAFPVTVRRDAPFTAREFTAYLESRQIETRRLFGGNLLAHPAYRSVRRRVVGETPIADWALQGTFFVGVYPGLTQERREYLIGALLDFLESRRT